MIEEMKKLTPENLLVEIDLIVKTFDSYFVSGLYIPEMINFNQGYKTIAELEGLDALSLEDEAMHESLMNIGYMYLYDCYYLKTLEVKGVPIAIRVSYATHLSVSIYPYLKVQEISETSYLPLAPFVQQFSTGAKFIADEDVLNPIHYLGESMRLENLPWAALQKIVTALQEFAIESKCKDVETKHSIENIEHHNVNIK